MILTTKNAFQWVAKAAGKNDVREYLNFVYVNDGVMYAADGHRIHWAQADRDDGYYDAITGLPFNLDAEYPNVKRVIHRTFIPAQTIALADMPQGQINPTFPYHDVTDELRVNSKYLLAALNGATELSYRLGDMGLRGESEFGEFIIMGMRK